MTKAISLIILFISVFAFQKNAKGQFNSNTSSISVIYPQPATSLYNSKAGDLNFAFGAGGNGPLFELAYSPLKHLSIQSNYLRNIYDSQFGTSFDDALKIGIGGYYFFELKRLRNRREKIKPNVGMNRGFLIDGYFNLGTGSKNAIYETSSHKSSFNTIGAELGLHYFGKLISLHFSVNRNLIAYKKYSIIGNTPDPILDVADLLIIDRSLELMTINLRQTFGAKQVRLYFNFNLPIFKAGDAQFIQNNAPFSFQTLTSAIGVILNLNSIFKKDFSLANLSGNDE